VNACAHTYTKPQTSSTRSRGLGWRIHGSVEDTKLSTNKQHTLYNEGTQVLFNATQEFSEWSNMQLNLGKTVVIVTDCGNGELDPPRLTYKN
jgi:hypothetical protein